MTRREMLDRIKELEEENEDLRSRLDEIGNLASAEDEDEEEDEGRD
jgi:hypothetical protein